MPREPGEKVQRIPITYFEGVNSTVQHVIARKTELSHLENARAPVVGVLEKREGQSILGTDSEGETLITEGNFGLFYFPNENSTPNQGLFRVSSLDGSNAEIMMLDNDDHWLELGIDDSSGLTNATCDFANAEGNMIIVNGVDANRMVNQQVDNIVTASEPGSMFNSPVANKVAFYKSRIYLADYIVGSVRYKTNILRSSYPMGIISLVNEDVTAVVADATIGPDNYWKIPVTENKYFYLDEGMDEYEIYRGNQKVATISDLVTFTETMIVAEESTVTFEGTFDSFLASDEIWIAGTFEGEKQYRWINNASTIGRDVKQYDTFKLVGGDESSVTLMEPIGNVLLIANKNAMMTWDDYNLQNFDLGIGCSSLNGYTKLKGSLYFIHYSGIYSTTGNAPQLISRKIERYLKGVSKSGFENAAVGYKGLSVFFSVGNVQLYNNDGSFWKTLIDTTFEFNIADQNWYVHTNVSATQFETFIGDDGQERLSMCSITYAEDPVLGPELMVNGSFTGSADNWELGEGWSYGDNDVGYIAPQP